jgi:hypothetical protein
MWNPVMRGVDYSWSKVVCDLSSYIFLTTHTTVFSVQLDSLHSLNIFDEQHALLSFGKYL